MNHLTNLTSYSEIACNWQDCHLYARWSARVLGKEASFVTFGQISMLVRLALQVCVRLLIAHFSFICMFAMLARLVRAGSYDVTFLPLLTISSDQRHETTERQKQALLRPLKCKG